jgi:hypothetical protein
VAIIKLVIKKKKKIVIILHFELIAHFCKKAGLLAIDYDYVILCNSFANLFIKLTLYWPIIKVIIDFF